MSTIATQNKILSEKAMKVFGAMNLLETRVTKRKSHSTIFNIKGGDNLLNKLTQNNVLCAQRGNGIRLSFHFYNTQNEIDEVVKILKTGM